MNINVIKRDGTVVPFLVEKITSAVNKAFVATGEVPVSKLNSISSIISHKVLLRLDEKYSDEIDIEDIQNEVESVLMERGYKRTAKAYILYRAERERIRNKNTQLMKTLDEIARSDAKDNDIKRENANIDGNTAMGIMLKFGSESAKAYYRSYMLTDRINKEHEDGFIHIHDLDFYNLTMTCCQIDLTRLFSGGFSTGHGCLREPNHIEGYAALAAIAIQANQNDMHGGQSVPNFDRDMALGIKKTFFKLYRLRLIDAVEDLFTVNNVVEFVDEILRKTKNECGQIPELSDDTDYDSKVEKSISECINAPLSITHTLIKNVRKRAVRETNNATYQAMESLIHNLNTMHSRAGAQVPFSSLNYGTDTSPEGRMVTRNILEATKAGLGNGETPIFPIQVFRLKKGINMNEGEPNYDLFKLALECSAKRLFPNFAFQDAPFNLKYYKEGRPETEIAYMGCRTRVIGNVHDPQNEISYSRGNLSFTSINLPRLAIMSEHNMETFFQALDEKLELVAEQLLDRFAIQASKKVYNFPFLMGQGVWLGANKLDRDDEISEVIKHGTLSIGFIGLAETLTSLIGYHHGQSDEAQQLGLKIIRHMRNFCERKSEETGLNFTLLATPAEGLAGRFLRMDRSRFSEIKGVTDKEYYTNSFHIPVDFSISAYQKIKLEAPYHELTNAGHISYIELDGDLQKNLSSFETIVKFMGECGIGYGAVNHPLDQDPECGFVGVINDECPKCGREEKDGVPFDRIRRITGYLVGTVERFNNAKRAEERDRIKHR